MDKWKRTAHITKGPDPTKFVVWEKGDLSITEFQQGYYINKNNSPTNSPMEIFIINLGKELHQALEREFDVEDRDRRVAENDDGIYGEA